MRQAWLFMLGGNSIVQSNKVKNELLTHWTGEEHAVALLGWRLLPSVQLGVQGWQTAWGGTKEPPSEPCCAQPPWVDLISHAFRNLQYHPGLPLNQQEKWVPASKCTSEAIL